MATTTQFFGSTKSILRVNSPCCHIVLKQKTWVSKPRAVDVSRPGASHAINLFSTKSNEFVNGTHQTAEIVCVKQEDCSQEPWEQKQKGWIGHDKTRQQQALQISHHLFSPPADADALRHDLQSRLASSQQIRPPDHELVGCLVGWDDLQLIEGELKNCNRLKALLVYKLEVRFGNMPGMCILQAGKARTKQHLPNWVGWGELPGRQFYQTCNKFGTF